MNRYPLVMTIVFIGLSWVVSRIYPFNPGLGIIGKMAGGIVLFCGVSLFLVAVGHFRIQGTTVMPTREPDKLVSEGIYRVTRNPMYLGMLLMLIGFPFVMESVTGLIFSLLFFLIMDRSVIPREERVVEGVFGEEYRWYKSKTRRWI